MKVLEFYNCDKQGSLISPMTSSFKSEILIRDERFSVALSLVKHFSLSSSLLFYSALIQS